MLPATNYLLVGTLSIGIPSLCSFEQGKLEHVERYKISLDDDCSISFPEPTCLLVSAKTRSSGIINFQSPRY